MEEYGKKRILAVDDDAVMLTFFNEVLTSQGYHVTCASGGQAAINHLKESSFDCVLLDFYMPDKDGLDVIASMYGRGDRTSTIIISSGLTDYYTAAIKGFGITREILKKPVSAETLLQTVEHMMMTGGGER